jgi:hypothetical protein
MKVHMRFIPQEAIEQKKREKHQKMEDAAAAKKAQTTKKNAKTVVDTLANPLLLFEEETRKHEAKGPSYMLDSATLLLSRVKILVDTATQSMLGVDGAPTEFDMEEVKLAKNEMVVKMRTS